MTATSGAEHRPGASPGRESMVGRTLHAGIRVLEQVEESPLPQYRAEYPTGLKVAVLILGSTSDDSAAVALLQERFRYATQIQHPNVAAIHELSETHDGLVYAVAECLTGELLSETLARRGSLPLEEALDLCLQAAAGLQAAHNLGWVHGSLSPYTILLTQMVSGRPLVKLIGFTQEFLLRQTGAEPPIGRGVSPQYASPERIAGHKPDERSDVFSLGAVLHHLLTGRPPNGSRVGALPEVTRAVLTRALAPVPDQRFQTIAEFAGALERAALVATKPKWTMANRSVIRRVAGVTLVVITLAGLSMLWSLPRQPVSVARPASETVTRAPPAKNVETRSTPQRTGRVVPIARDSTPGGISNRAGNGRSPARVSRARAAVEQGSRSTPRPTTTNGRSGSDPILPKVDKPAAAGVRSNDSAPQPKLSPFRRSHPWAAVPGKRFYYRSSCRVALQSTELLYFRSEDEARASGFVPSRVPGCY